MFDFIVPACIMAGIPTEKREREAAKMTKQLPEHFFTTDGALYDTRKPEWHKLPPLRPVYNRHFSEITTTAEFKASLRAGEYTFPGGYTLAFTTADSCVLCFDCARKEAHLILDSIKSDCRDGWCVDGMINVDECDDRIWCDHCGGILSDPCD